MPPRDANRRCLARRPNRRPKPNAPRKAVANCVRISFILCSSEDIFRNHQGGHEAACQSCRPDQAFRQSDDTGNGVSSQHIADGVGHCKTWDEQHDITDQDLVHMQQREKCTEDSNQQPRHQGDQKI